jgi:hypothetical protein
MESNEKQIIDNLFNRLQQAEVQSGPRDTAAETLIRQAVDRQPAAPYYMAQAILVQEQALQNFNHRVQELEQELAQRPAGGGFLAGLFGSGNQSHHPGAASRPLAASQPGSAYGATPFSQGSRGSFLGSALQTAAAVVGGVLIGNAIAGLFTEEAQAAEPAPEESPTDAEPSDEGFGGDDESFL